MNLRKVTNIIMDEESFDKIALGIHGNMQFCKACLGRTRLQTEIGHA
jgi:hypothetical protein